MKKYINIYHKFHEDNIPMIDDMKLISFFINNGD